MKTKGVVMKGGEREREREECQIREEGVEEELRVSLRWL